MPNKDAMLCDIETGICGPAGEDNSVTGLIDLTALPIKKDADLVTQQTEEDK